MLLSIILKRFGILGYPVALIRAQNNNNIAASTQPDECQILEKILRFLVGCRATLHQNLRTEVGLVNGTSGIVHDILYISKEDKNHVEMIPACVPFRFPSYSGPTLHDGLIPITCISSF